MYFLILHFIMAASHMILNEIYLYHFLFISSYSGYNVEATLIEFSYLDVLNHGYNI